ncbi:MAG: NupC/NupG family nucleoside CNT transporter [Desulfatibacillaceae bacterium]
MIAVLHGVLGFAAMGLVALAFSENRKAVEWRTVASAYGLQVLLAVLLLKLPTAQTLFLLLNEMVNALQNATEAGTSFVFGYLGGGNVPFETVEGANTYIFAFRGLPLILVVSALSALLFHWRVLPLLVRGFAWVLRRSLGVGGAEGLAASSNVFIGMIEAPLFVRPYLGRMARGELFCLMCGGMATIAGTVMVLYATILAGVLPDALGHLLVASVISAPAAVAVARIMIPTPREELTGDVQPDHEPAANSIDAVSRGTFQGITLLLNVVAMLIVFVALVHLVNAILGFLPYYGDGPITLQRILGWLLWPVVWLIGVPAAEAQTAGGLMGTKIVLNEFLAYLDLAGLPRDMLSDRSRMIMTYALCGFANFGSLGIMIGGLGGMAPERRQEIVRMGLKAILGGVLATCMTGALVGVLYAG